MKSPKGPAHLAKGGRSGLLFSLPYAIFFLAFVAYPLTFSLILVFHRWNIVTPMEWIGLKNFVRLVHDPLVLKAFVNTLVFLLLHIPLQIVVALSFALLLNTRVRFRGFFRALFFLPVVVSGVAVTILWQQLYSYDYGVLNTLLNTMGIPSVPWLVDAAWAMPSISSAIRMIESTIGLSAGSPMRRPFVSRASNVAVAARTKPIRMDATPSRIGRSSWTDKKVPTNAMARPIREALSSKSTMKDGGSLLLRIALKSSE